MSRDEINVKRHNGLHLVKILEEVMVMLETKLDY